MCVCVREREREEYQTKVVWGWELCWGIGIERGSFLVWACTTVDRVVIRACLVLSFRSNQTNGNVNLTPFDDSNVNVPRVESS